jgi:hypothetical protein
MIDVSKGVPGVNAPEPSNYQEFWPYYLSQHLHPMTEKVHAASTTGAVATFLAALATRRWRMLGLSPLVAYGPAFASHFIWEGNKPVTLQGNPFWAMRADFEMVYKVFTGRIEAEVRAIREGLHAASGEDRGTPSRLRASA